VSLARLLSAGVVVRDERGSYRLGARAEPVRQRVASWRRSDERLVAEWNQQWIGLQAGSVPRGSAIAKRRSQQARRFLGFRELRPGLLVRPDNWIVGVHGVRNQLAELGLEADALVFGLRDLDAETEALARTLWDGERLAAQYAEMKAALDASRGRLSRMGVAQAMSESFLVGGKALRLLALDPLLPEEISPGAARESLIANMDDYDRQGRTCWSAFMADFGLPHLRAPLDMRIAADALEAPTPSADRRSAVSTRG